MVQAVPVASPPPLPQKLPAPPAADIQQALNGWAAAWSAKDYPKYINFYSSHFQPEAGRSLTQWMNERRARLGKPGEIRVDISDVKIEQGEKDKAVTEFRQTYSSQDYRDIVPKRMDWAREDGQWKIMREQVLAPLPSISDSKPRKSKPRKRVKYCPCPATDK
jgi:adhesin transport system outer membrane protein